jgi:GrpB-like predicted nucleotidyltransferase (UPF0157 family)
MSQRSKEPPFAIADAERAREAAQRLFATVSGLLATRLPPTADVRHIGATAVPGCLTKGDLDIVVRIPAADFATADAALASLFARNEGSIRTETFSAFEDATSKPHLGIQLATIDGPSDFFHLFVEALQCSPQLVGEYNALKRHYDGIDMDVYRAAKDDFVERVLADLASRNGVG